VVVVVVVVVVVDAEDDDEEVELDREDLVRDAVSVVGESDAGESEVDEEASAERAGMSGEEGGF